MKGDRRAVSGCYDLGGAEGGALGADVDRIQIDRKGQTPDRKVGEGVGVKNVGDDSVLVIQTVARYLTVGCPPWAAAQDRGGAPPLRHISPLVSLFSRSLGGPGNFGDDFD